MRRRIYLASPYSSPDSETRLIRYKSACHAAALIMMKGDLVFSPIAHSHPVATCHSLPGDFEFWRSWCLSFLRYWATHFTILEIPGWQKSSGIAAEEAVARELGLIILPWQKILEQKNA